MRLKDKVAVVTGAGGGLGEGICLCLAREGANIVACDVNLELAEAVAKKVREEGQKAITAKADVRFYNECEEVMAAAVKEFGRIDILVCNHGVSGFALRKDSDDPPVLENLSEDDWDLTIDVNLKGVFNCNKAAVPYFKKQEAGRIINISSIGGRKGVDFIPHYCASKAGVILFTQAIALQLAPFGINANTICPGLVWTPMWQEAAKVLSMSHPAFKGLPLDTVFDAAVHAMIPMQRPQTPEDVGNAVVFFASNQAKEITGQALNVDGGAIFS
ncbi:MAG: SDR family NAD(P)-dependent oxidoreductase [Syntrophorhabdaceae bacterium]